ncbi:Uncharacterised protein [Serratia rubidaea]|uniref:Uncharacterized protein n=1 Tax=Serratia rubidaea TaxID=61652 RepID=A0A4U9HCE0_SERRU|nr:Uncharacterised protein [Serratia rubidaea]
MLIDKPQLAANPAAVHQSRRLFRLGRKLRRRQLQLRRQLRVKLAFQRVVRRAQIINVSACRQRQQQLNRGDRVILMQQIDALPAAFDRHLTGQKTPRMTLGAHQPGQA